MDGQSDRPQPSSAEETREISVRKRRLVYRYPWQVASTLEYYSDTDWAGCPKSRKSTSGGCLMSGSHLLKSWSSTQPSISLSSGEAE